jgi:general secretion pathway protein C
MFAPPPADPRWSVAVVRDEETATTGPFGVGARLGDATIEAIEQVRVVLDVGHGRRELLELLRERPRAGPAGHRGAADAIGHGIQRTGTHSFEVRRAALDRFLSGGMTASMPRVVPDVRDGQPVGLRLLGVGSDGPFAALGLASGDVLREVNGRSIATPDEALAAYATLRTAGHVWLVIERGGQRIRMDYAIR